MRILVLLVAIGLLLFFINSWIRMLKFKPPESGRKPGETEKMAQCRVCGSYVPASRAITHDGMHFCSREHLREYLETGSGDDNG